ncbi:rapamycin-insensitive companion of mTOR-like [Gigantopelta aegis]|uniref:rapamycin-insensitive companion of mTOR-like n=1 Tax=Gigantopelta aegis TaxID=1735272 RepID=UPI001B88CD65|nr:rapamycin-insensitive companion of mTOR-like [Gigantopelta aegis]
MAASMVRQGRNLRSGRFRNRHESETEIRLDFAKEPKENVKEILHHIVLKSVCPKAKKLGYLNCFVRLIHYVKKSSNALTFGFTTKEILSCLRVGLLDEAKEVRAATLRVLRHLLLFDDTLDTLLFLRLDYFVARCLDTCLDNEIERIHAVKLIRKIIQIAPHKLPSSFVFPLISIGKDGASERDRLLRVSLATICEIAISNISLMSQCGGLNCLLQNILDSHQYPRLNESLVCTVLYLLNHPRTRHYIRANTDLEQLLAPFTDCHFRYSGETDHHHADDKEARFIAGKMALVCMMRSWPGLIRLCHPEGSGLQSLIGILYLPYTEIRKNIMETLFDLFRLTLPQWTSDFATALISVDRSDMQETWRLSEGFIVEEGRAVLPHLAKTRTNLVENHLALILSAWISAGILEALIEVVISSEGALFTRAVILLGELLHLAYKLLPPETSSHSHCLPSLITMASSFEIPLAKRHQASVAVTNLTHLHSLKKRGPVPHSLFLDQLLQHAGKFIEFVGRHWHLKRDSLSELYFTKALADDLVSQVVRDTQILGNRDWKCWDWNLISSLLKWPDDKLRRLDDQNVIRLVKKVIYFFKPTNDQFSRMDLKCDNSRLFCKVGCHLIDFLIKSHQDEAQKHVTEWLTDIAQCLYELSAHRVAPESIFGMNSMHHSLSQFYFLFIGRFSLTPRGDRFLENTGIFQNLLDLIGPNTQDIYIKLAVASLNYSREGSARTILSKALTASSETGRIYCTRFLRVLLRTGIASFSSWGIEFLVTQLYDPSQIVAGVALNILDEASEINENLESLIKLRPSLLHLGDQGVMMLCRFLSVPKGFKSLMDSNFVMHELQKWNKGFNTRYVQIVEEMLNEALTTYEKTYEGSFTRRSIQKHPQKDVFLPMHLYGQLTMHEDGFDMLKKEECVHQYNQYVRSLELLSDDHILKLKTALWALGHLGISVEGVTYLDKERLIPEFIRLAEECGVFSIRGTAFYVLGLLASTRKGTEILARYGWESMCRTREDLWPVMDEGGCFPFQYRGYLGDSCSSFHSAFKGDGDKVMVMGSTQLSFIEEEEKGDNSDQNCSCDKTNIHSMKSLNIPILVNDKVPVLLQHSVKDMPSDRTLQSDTVEFHQFHNVSVKSNSEKLNVKLQPETHTQTVNTIVSEMDKSTKTTPVATSVITSVIIDKSAAFVHQSQGSEGEMSPSNNQKENKFTFTVGSMSPDGDNKGQEKFSFKLGGSSVVREDRSSSDSSHKSKSRTSSFNTDSTTSGISSCDSGLMPTLTVSPLSPIASASSLNTIPASVQLDTTDKVHPSTVNRRLVNLTRVPSLRRRSAASSLGISRSVETVSAYTSYRDALGYATLRIIKRQRTYSSEGEGDASVSLFVEPLITRTCSTESDSSVDNMYLSTIRSNMSCASLVDCEVQQTSPFNTLNKSAIKANKPTNRFIGLTLPVDIHMIFEVIEGEDQRSSVSAKDEYTKISNRLSVRKGSLSVNVPPLKYDSLFEHQADICLVCRRNRQSQKSDHEEDYIRDYNDIPPIDCDSDGGTGQLGGSLQGIKTSRPRGESIIVSSETPGSGTSETSSDTAPKKLSEDTPEGRTLVRKEILRLIISLCSSVGLKGSEQALLTLKQKFPKAFQDLCFYSDVSDLLANYSFRLLARRFIQELFDEFDITLLLEEPRNMLGISNTEKNGNLASVRQESLDSFPESFR